MKRNTFVKRRVTVILLLVLLMSACSFPVHAEAALSATFEAVEDTEFGAVSLGCSPEEFLQVGFCLGDSCDVELGNGFRLEDVPVFDGYYVRFGCPLIVLYPGYVYPSFDYSSTGNMWKYANVEAGDTITVTLREAGKYRDIQDALSAVYGNDMDQFISEEAFCNFRELSGGDLCPGMFYRGASPVDNRNMRAASADALIRNAGIGFILDLADTKEKAAAYPLFRGSRFEELYCDGRAACLGLKTDYRAPAYTEALANGFRAMIEQDQPVYIHCTEGKDRTGFVCILLEALAGASYEEILRDYMLSYECYYGITETDTPEKFAAIVDIRFLDMLNWLADVPNGTDLSGKTFEQSARTYLINAGMTETEIAALRDFLTGEGDWRSVPE